MRALLIVIPCCASASVIAAEALQVGPEVSHRAAVLGELSKRSGLPDDELNRLLADCSANQQSMYFCAWRDQIAAEKTFDKVLVEKQLQLPQCKTFIESKAKSWSRIRDRSCDRSATKKWGEGSMKPTALAICMTAETARMTRRLERVNGCKTR